MIGGTKPKLAHHIGIGRITSLKYIVRHSLPRRIMLQNQIDRLFVGIEKRAGAQALGLGLGLGDRNETLGAGEGDGLGFKIEVVGDSTMRVRGGLVSICANATIGVRVPKAFEFE